MAVAWGSKTTATQLTTVSTIQYFDEIISLAANQFAQIQLTGNSSGTTDDLDIEVTSTLDDATEDWDTVPIVAQRLDCSDGADNIVSIILPAGPYRSRVSVTRAGSTDTFSADMSYRIGTRS